jgi:predicted SnoaL-like aldol condensation-catalyzing enzyme
MATRSWSGGCTAASWQAAIPPSPSSCWPDDYLDHDIPGVGEGGKPELVAAVLAVRASFPDIVPTLGPVLAEADLVAVRIQAHGTHTGAPFPPGIPATGRSMTWKEVHILRCASGRITEHWGVFDMLGILQQLGAIPA